MEEYGEIKIMPNEKEVVEKAKSNNEEFEALYNFYFPKIYGYVFKRVGSKEVAEDIVSIVFIKAFSNLNNFEYRQSFSSWVFKIATNSLIDYYRKNSKHKEVKLTINLINTLSVEPKNNFDQNYNKKIVTNILNRMSAKYQRVIQLKFFAEFDYTEIAESLNISEGNARVLTHRALKKFHNIYKKYGK